MSTRARLKSAPPEGHGLIGAITDPAFAGLVSGRGAEDVLVIALLRPTDISKKGTAQGAHQTVVYDYVQLEAFRNPSEVESMRLRLAELYRKRTSTNTEPLPLEFEGLEDAQKRKSLLQLIDEWAGEQGHDEAALKRLWTNYYAHDDNVDKKHWRKASADTLREFALSERIIAEEEPGEKTAEQRRDEAFVEPEDTGAPNADEAAEDAAEAATE